MRSLFLHPPGWMVAAALAFLGCGGGPVESAADPHVGAIWITVTTLGADPDLDGYLVQVDNGPSRVVLANQSLAWEGLEGDHTVVVSGLANNCTVANGDTRTVRVVAGTRGAQGVAAAFEITCTRVQKIAFTEAILDFYYGTTLRLVVIHADGSEGTYYDFGDGASWAPDGSRLVFRRAFCFGTCVGSGLFTADLDRPPGTATQLTSNEFDRDPDWSPDGRTIAFAHEGALYRINRDGTGDAVLFRPTPGISIAEPDWSPDGTRLVFSCQVEIANRDICMVNAGGTGFQRLTSGPEQDSHPAWRPDGGAIAFTTNRYSPTLDIAVMGPDGSGVTRLLDGREAAWSPDGTKLVFVEHACPPGRTCTITGIAIANADGTGRSRITDGVHHEPAWRP